MSLLIFCCDDVIDCTEHPWLREGGNASDKPIDSAVLSRMKQFRAMNKLKKLALKVGCEKMLMIDFHFQTLMESETNSRSLPKIFLKKRSKG